MYPNYPHSPDLLCFSPGRGLSGLSGSLSTLSGSLRASLAVWSNTHVLVEYLFAQLWQPAGEQQVRSMRLDLLLTLGHLGPLKALISLLDLLALTPGVVSSVTRLGLGPLGISLIRLFLLHSSFSFDLDSSISLSQTGLSSGFDVSKASDSLVQRPLHLQS